MKIKTKKVLRGPQKIQDPSVNLGPCAGDSAFQSVYARSLQNFISRPEVWILGSFGKPCCRKCPLSSVKGKGRKLAQRRGTTSTENMRVTRRKPVASDRRGSRMRLPSPFGAVSDLFFEAAFHKIACVWVGGGG